MPNSGVATPSTYMIDGRQYVVIAASGAAGSEIDARRGLISLLRCHAETNRQIAEVLSRADLSR